MRKLIALLLYLLLAVLPVSALADEIVYTEGTLYYVVRDDSITITGCFGRDAEVTVPSMIAGTPVNTVARGAFTENSYVKTLKLPDTISKIERGAIADGIRVIYNANTDHPQDTPTELILSNMDPEPTATATAEATATARPEATVAPTDVPNETPDAGATATAGAAATAEAATAAVTATAGTVDDATPAATPLPTEAGDKIGEWDVDLDETPSPEATATAVPVVTEGPEPTAAEGTETPAPVDEKTTKPDETGKGMPGWAWVMIGAAVFICVGVAVYAGLAKSRGKK